MTKDNQTSAHSGMLATLAHCLYLDFVSKFRLGEAQTQMEDHGRSCAPWLTACTWILFRSLDLGKHKLSKSTGVCEKKYHVQSTS
eukprot:6504555-Karenia_brevis.AAC.1